MIQDHWKYYIGSLTLVTSSAADLLLRGNESYNQKRGFHESPGGKVYFLFVISELGMAATLTAGSGMR